MCPIRNLSSNEGPGYDQVLASCEGLVQLWSDKIVGDLYRGRTGATVLGDGFGQANAGEEFLLSTRQVSGALFSLFLLRTNEGALRNSWRPILTRMVSRDVSRMTTWVSRRLMEVNRTCWVAYVRWMFLSPDEVQSPLSLAKCENASTADYFLYSRKCLQMQQTIREICLSEM